jgi:hypothetical protein
MTVSTAGGATGDSAPAPAESPAPRPPQPSSTADADEVASAACSAPTGSVPFFACDADRDGRADVAGLVDRLDRELPDRGYVFL